MKRFLILAVVTASTLSAPTFAADVGVSVNIGQPGFYGQLNIGGYPPPQLIYRQPRVVEVVPVERPPIYLRVPPRHSRNWNRYCHEYQACGERVYFVQDGWYNRDYAPRYREQHYRGGEYREQRDERRYENRDGRREGFREGEGHDRHRRDQDGGR